MTLSPQRERVHGTLSIDKFVISCTQGCHAIVMRDEVLGHEIAIGQRRGTTGRSSGCRALAEIKMLRQPRLLQRRRWRWRRGWRWWSEREHAEKDADGADASRCNVDDAIWPEVRRFGEIGRSTSTGSRQGAAHRRPRPCYRGPHIRPGILLRGYKVRTSLSLSLPSTYERIIQSFINTLIYIYRFWNIYSRRRVTFRFIFLTSK